MEHQEPLRQQEQAVQDPLCPVLPYRASATYPCSCDLLCDIPLCPGREAACQEREEGDFVRYRGVSTADQDEMVGVVLVQTESDRAGTWAGGHHGEVKAQSKHDGSHNRHELCNPQHPQRGLPVNANS